MACIECQLVSKVQNKSGIVRRGKGKNNNLRLSRRVVTSNIGSPNQGKKVVVLSACIGLDILDRS